MEYLVDELPVDYRKEHFVVYRNKNSEFIVHNTNIPFDSGHTHIASKKFSRCVIDYALRKSFPLDLTYRQLESLRRIVGDVGVEEKIIALKKKKHKNNKQKFRKCNRDGI